MNPRAAPAAVLLWLAAGCNQRADGASAAPAARASAAPTTPAATSASAAPAASANDAAPPPLGAAAEGLAVGDVGLGVPGCRAIAIQGAAKDGRGHDVTPESRFDGTLWLDVLAKGAVTLKHPASGRELTLHGPALALPCKEHEEWFVVVRGRVTTTTWAGAAPGSEVLLATPFALVRYGDANLDVRVEDARLIVKSTTGDAWLETGRPAAARDRKVAAGTQEELRGPPEDAKTSLAACERAAAQAESAARAVLERKSAVPLGESAAAHVLARRAAAAACAVTGAVIGRLAPGPEREGLARAVKQAEVRYRTLARLSRPHE